MEGQWPSGPEGVHTRRGNRRFDSLRRGKVGNFGQIFTLKLHFQRKNLPKVAKLMPPQGIEPGVFAWCDADATNCAVMLMQEHQYAGRRTKGAVSAERWAKGLKADQHLGFHASAQWANHGCALQLKERRTDV